MLTPAQLRAMADARVADAKVLAAGGRYDAAVYLVGYAVEYQLKGRVAATLLSAGGWPQTPPEFNRFKRLQAHDLNDLLDLSDGRPVIVAGGCEPSWQYVTSNWTVDKRYAVVGTSTAADAARMIVEVEQVLRCL